MKEWGVYSNKAKQYGTPHPTVIFSPCKIKKNVKLEIIKKADVIAGQIWTNKKNGDQNVFII
jgi:hypothetical protein